MNLQQDSFILDLVQKFEKNNHLLLTCHLISSIYHCHINTAKSYLSIIYEKFKKQEIKLENNAQLRAIHSVYGVVGGGLSISLVSEQNLATHTLSLDSVLSCELYCLHTLPVTHANVLFAGDRVSGPAIDHLPNSCSSIVNSTVQISANSTHACDHTQTDTTQTPVTAEAEIGAVAADSFRVRNEPANGHCAQSKIQHKQNMMERMFQKRKRSESVDKTEPVIKEVEVNREPEKSIKKEVEVHNEQEKSIKKEVEVNHLPEKSIKKEVEVHNEPQTSTKNSRAVKPKSSTQCGGQSGSVAVITNCELKTVKFGSTSSSERPANSAGRKKAARGVAATRRRRIMAIESEDSSSSQEDDEDDDVPAPSPDAIVQQQQSQEEGPCSVIHSDSEEVCDSSQTPSTEGVVKCCVQAVDTTYLDRDGFMVTKKEFRMKQMSAPQSTTTEKTHKPTASSSHRVPPHTPTSAPSSVCIKQSSIRSFFAKS